MRKVVKQVWAGVLGLVMVWAAPAMADDHSFAFRQAVAEAAAADRDIAAFYKARDYNSFWTGGGADQARRRALMQALGRAAHHGLADRTALRADLLAQMSGAKTTRDLGQLEAKLSAVFLDLAIDLQTGILRPDGLYDAMQRRVPLRQRASYLENLGRSAPAGFFRALPPQTANYRALLNAKQQMHAVLAQGGWGAPVPEQTLRPGDRGPDVVALRNRLMRMGYLRRSTAADYNAALTQAVRLFQERHGLEQDGVAGPGTLREVNQNPQSRLQAIHVALERERWNNRDLGPRHIEVNLADFSAKIIDDGKVTFETRSVVGARNPDRQSPEFSDVMEFMIVNPSWYVPRSIVTKEYLPELQEDPGAIDHIELTDENGQQVDRTAIDFSQFDENSFPFSMRQPPSQTNALGLVKFMFPNPHNIYLHDTPAKRLFAREVRAFSHGCIRLADPFDFAYALLARQSRDPKGDFARALATGKETRIDLQQKVPVHLIYRTAITTNKGEIAFRRDVYGRDALIWEALRNAGVEMPGVQG